MAKTVKLNESVTLNGVTYDQGKEISISDELFADLGDKVSEIKPKVEPKK